MVPKIFWSAFPWRKGAIVNQARFAPLRKPLAFENRISDSEIAPDPDG